MPWKEWLHLLFLVIRARAKVDASPGMYPNSRERPLRASAVGYQPTLASWKDGIMERSGVYYASPGACCEVKYEVAAKSIGIRPGPNSRNKPCQSDR